MSVASADTANVQRDCCRMCKRLPRMFSHLRIEPRRSDEIGTGTGSKKIDVIRKIRTPAKVDGYIDQGFIQRNRYGGKAANAVLVAESFAKTLAQQYGCVLYGVMRVDIEITF